MQTITETIFSYKQIQKLISQQYNFLYDESGLGLMHIFQERLCKLGTKIPKEQVKKTYSVIQILKKIGYPEIDSKLKYFFPNGIENFSLVLDCDGNWSHVNKIDTNHTQQSIIICDYIFTLLNDNNLHNNELGINICNYIMNSETKKGLLLLKNDNKFYDFINTINLFDYIDVIKETSRKGEEAEEQVKQFWIDKGFDIIFQGGNGDLIDMKFNIDLIVYREDYGYKTVQVKNKQPKYTEKYKSIDWFAIRDGNIRIKDTKTLNIIPF